MFYEYKCRECNNIHTEVRKIAERNEPSTCPGCGGGCEFKISTPNFSGGGQGWYGRDRPSKISSKNLESGDY